MCLYNKNESVSKALYSHEFPCFHAIYKAKYTRGLKKIWSNIEKGRRWWPRFLFSHSNAIYREFFGHVLWKLDGAEIVSIDSHVIQKRTRTLYHTHKRKLECCSQECVLL